MAIEYGASKGYVKVPDEFPGSWEIGFMNYIRGEKKYLGDIKIYNLNIHTTADTMAKDPAGFTNMEDDLKLALGNNKYYPPCPETDSIRRMYSKFYPTNPSFTPIKTWYV